MTEEEHEEDFLSPAERQAAIVRRIEEAWFTTHRQVSLELLVSTAAALRGGCRNHSQAADEALRLIDTCARLLEHNKTHAEREKQMRDIRAALKLKPGAAVPFREGIKIITGQPRSERAEEDFITYLWAATRATSPYEVRERVVAQFADFERKGFAIERLLITRKMFEAYRQDGLLGKKRRPAKKDLEKKKRGRGRQKIGEDALKPRALAT